MHDENNGNLPWWARSLDDSDKSYGTIKKYSAGSIAASVLIVLAFISVISWTIWGVDPARATKGQHNSTHYPASVEAVLSQCGNVFTFDSPEEYSGVFDPEEIIENAGDKAPEVEIPDHPMIVPVYGYMTEWEDGEDLFSSNSYSGEEIPSRSKILREMWDGATIIWFSPSISEDQQEKLALVAQDHPDVVAIEWVGGDLPLGRKFAFSSWNISQSCEVWDDEVFEQFLDTVDERSDLKPSSENPPAAELDEDGILKEIDPRRR